VVQQLDVKDLFEIANDAIGQRDDAEMATVALTRLEADDREVVELKVYGGLTFRNIAEVTNMPQGTIATKYRRSLESLRHWLTKELR
jgi:RNA polymerase sigma-70 factor (ECF subfamily)